jgi:hypothetical protein
LPFGGCIHGDAGRGVEESWTFTLGLAIMVLVALLFIVASVLFATDFVKDN